MSLFDFVARKLAPVPKVESFDSYLFIGAHPDDIEVGAGATVAKLISMGKKVSFLICTDGRYGTEKEDISLDDLVKIRREEALVSAKMLGVSNVYFLGFSDGGFYNPREVTLEIAKYICKAKPDMVLCPDPTLPCELHVDHTNTGYSAGNAFIMGGNLHIMKELGEKNHAPKAIGYYFTHRPNRYVKTFKFRNAPAEALTAFKSQFPTDTPEQKKIVKLLKLYNSFKCFRNGLHVCSLSADAFRVLSQIHVHCAPEADRL